MCVCLKTKYGCELQVYIPIKIDIHTGVAVPENQYSGSVVLRGSIFVPFVVDIGCYIWCLNMQDAIDILHWMRWFLTTNHYLCPIANTTEGWSREMALWAKHWLPNMNLLPGTHVVEGNTGSENCPVTSLCMHMCNTCTPPCICTHTLKINVTLLDVFYFMWVFCVCVHACVGGGGCTTSLLAAHRDQENTIRSSGSGVTDACELPCGCWESPRTSGRASSTHNHWTISP